MGIVHYTVEIKEKVHYSWHCEDYKHNMYILYLNDDVEKWMEENIGGEYSMEYSELAIHHRYGPQRTSPLMIFEHEEDAVAFKLRWI